MSSTDGQTDERPRREVAHRVFAAEFDDADLSYSESDEERAPNYVVTPTGARANRLFVAGVLTELERLESDQLRARIADPTGVFVVYAGQYQPEALAALERLSPPAFVAVTGKARTFQPADSDRVFTSIRPEHVSEIDAATRDRWTVETAARTLDRIGTFATALADGDTTDGGGVDLAREHYGTTPTYLAAVRELALDAARLVAGDAEEVRRLDVAPDQDGDTDLDELTGGSIGETTVAALVDSDGDGGDSGTATDVERERSGTGTEIATMADTQSTDPDEAAEASKTAEVAESVETAAEPNAEANATDTEHFESGSERPASTVGTDEEATISEDDQLTSEPEASVDDTGLTADETDGDGDTGAIGRSDGPDESRSTEDIEETEEFEGAEEFDLSEEERAEIEAEYGTDFSTGSEVDDPGEADIEPTAPPIDGDEGGPADERADDDAPDSEGGTSAEITIDEAGAASDAGSVDGVGTEEPGGSGTEPAEADVELDSDSESGDEGGAAAQSEREVETEATEDEPPPGEESATEASGTTDEGEATDEDAVSEDAVAEGTESAGDVDVTEAVMDAMRELDDGDGADREAVIERVGEEYGVGADEADDAIQDALMSGQCYEPGDGTLKAI